MILEPFGLAINSAVIYYLHTQYNSLVSLSILFNSVYNTNPNLVDLLHQSIFYTFYEE